MNLSSSLLTCPSGSNGASSESRWLRPFSSMITERPAAVRTSADVDPAGPVPTITTSQSRSVTAAHLFVGVAAGLDVAGVVDRDPTQAVTVAAVLGCAVRALARMP